MIFRKISFYAAIVGIIMAGILVKKLSTSPPDPVHFAPAVNPYEHTIAASGIIESIDKNLEIGVPHSAVIKEVKIAVGDQVNEGDLLFQLDDRELLGQLLIQKANVAVLNATHLRLRDQLERLDSVEDPRAISQEEINSKRHDVIIAEAQLQGAEAQLTHTILLLDRLNIRSPCCGTILQNNIRKGEYISAGSSPAVILGDIDHLQVRADIDEQNASSLMKHATATAFPKNNTQIKIPLSFVRIEPYVIPKQSLTGAGNERVDTRVLQVIYSFDKPSDLPLYVGQQVDIFIEKPISNTQGEIGQ